MIQQFWDSPKIKTSKCLPVPKVSFSFTIGSACPQTKQLFLCLHALYLYYVFWTQTNTFAFELFFFFKYSKTDLCWENGWTSILHQLQRPQKFLHTLLQTTVSGVRTKQCFFFKNQIKSGWNVENTYLNEIIVNDPIIAGQIKLITYLFEQIAEMRDEMDKTRQLMNLAIIVTFLLEKTKGLYSFLLVIQILLSLT